MIMMIAKMLDQLLFHYVLLMWYRVLVSLSENTTCITSTKLQRQAVQQLSGRVMENFNCIHPERNLQCENILR